MIGEPAGSDAGPRRPWARWVAATGGSGHLSLDAVVALVDDELPPAPTRRAVAHVSRCLSCAGEVAAQRQARRRLRGAETPGAPTSLLSSLRSIPEGDAPRPAAPAASRRRPRRSS